jgi:hypothetical protein
VREVRSIHFIHFGEVRHVFEKDATLDYVMKTQSRCGQDVLQIFHHHHRFFRDVRGYQVRSMAIWPETNNQWWIFTAWLYGPMGSGALSE